MFLLKSEKYGREAKIFATTTSISIKVGTEKSWEFTSSIKLDGGTINHEIETYEIKSGKNYTASSFLKSGSSEENLPENITKDDVLNQLVEDFSSCRKD